MRLETFSRAGAELIPRLLPWALVRTLMRFPMPANTTVSSEFSAVSKRSGRCSGEDFGPKTRSSFLSLQQKSPRASAWAAWEADCFQGLFLLMLPDDWPMATANRWKRFAEKPGSMETFEM